VLAPLLENSKEPSVMGSAFEQLSKASRGDEKLTLRLKFPLAALYPATRI